MMSSFGGFADIFTAPKPMCVKASAANCNTSVEPREAPFDPPGKEIGARRQRTWWRKCCACNLRRESARYEELPPATDAPVTSLVPDEAAPACSAQPCLSRPDSVRN